MASNEKESEWTRIPVRFFQVGKESYLSNMVTKIGGLGQIGRMSKFILEECCNDQS